MSCCKCHDHKFDPIPTRDYYSLYSAFAATQPAEMPAVFLGGIFALITAALVCGAGGYGFSLPRNDILIAVAMGVFQVGLGLVIYTIGSRVVPSAELVV